jgi:NAD(P)H dehydrogenase (quinone)
MSVPVGSIAVVGAAGRTGQQLLRALSARNVSVRALVRSAEQTGRISGGHRAVVADSADRAALIAAFTGATTVHFIPPLFSSQEEAYAANALAAAAAAKVERFVFHSALHADTPDMPHHARKARVERMVRASSLAWTIVQSAMYFTTAMLYFDEAHNEFRPPFSVTQRFNPIDPEDLSEAVANILCEPGHEFATYELAGAERLSFQDMAARASALTKSPVRAIVGRAQDALAGRGFSAEREREARAMYAHYDAHGLPGNGRVLSLLLKREPRSFGSFFAGFMRERGRTQSRAL